MRPAISASTTLQASQSSQAPTLRITHSIFKDTGANKATFLANSLSYTLTNMPVGGQSGLIQRSDGTFFLILWNQVENWNFATGAVISVQPSNVLVTFARSGAINVYDPTIGTAAQQTITGNQVTVALTDYPKYISFKFRK